MLRPRLLFACALLSCAPLLANPFVDPATPRDVRETHGDWRLVFSDEFEGAGSPHAKRWRYELGLVRKREPQEYVRSLDNVRQRAGSLELVARKLPSPKRNPRYKAAKEGEEPPKWPACQEKIRYTSGSVDTKGLFSFQYGKVEVRAKLPKGQGIWPAIWTLGAHGRHPDCGEIDIMEWVSSAPQTLWCTLHFAGSSALPATQHGGTFTSPVIADGQWHLYTLLWTDQALLFSFDNRLLYSFPIARANRADGSNPFRAPHYLKLNLALGDSTNWGGTLDESCLPQTFAIDYVRIWQAQEDLTPPEAPDEPPAHTPIP